jgi:hypothetical protein
MVALTTRYGEATHDTYSERPCLARDDWAIPDPRGQSRARIRAIREEIRDHVAKLIDVRGWSVLAVEQPSGGPDRGSGGATALSER